MLCNPLHENTLQCSCPSLYSRHHAIAAIRRTAVHMRYLQSATMCNLGTLKALARSTVECGSDLGHRHGTIKSNTTRISSFPAVMLITAGNCLPPDSCKKLMLPQHKRQHGRIDGFDQRDVAGDWSLTSVSWLQASETAVRVRGMVVSLYCNVDPSSSNTLMFGSFSRIELSIRMGLDTIKCFREPQTGHDSVYNVCLHAQMEDDRLEQTGELPTFVALKKALQRNNS